MRTQKIQLRKQIAQLKKQQLGFLDDETAKILARLEDHPVFQKAHTVLLYHSLKDEVNTHAFIEKWQGKKEILLPVVVGEELELRRYTGPQDLRSGSYGIEEPVGALFTDYERLELAVIPGVAFDSQGHRLGRGKGYYDRLLPQLPHTYKIGICFSFQWIEKIPVEPYDINMNEVITLSK